MDVKCAQGCSFSTGSYSGSVRELAGEPAQHPKNSPMLASRTGSCVGAAAGPWSCFLFSHVESLLLLICEGSKGDQLHGGGTGLTQVLTGAGSHV
jgi:hypothetical protein